MYFRITVLLIKIDLLLWTSYTVTPCKPSPHRDKECLRPLARSTFQLRDKFYALFQSPQKASPRHEHPASRTLCGIRSHDLGSLSDSTDAEAIIHGQNTSVKMWPWQVLVIGGVTCGGFLISDQWVLTAAHCINNTKYVTAGRSNTLKWSEHGVYRKTALQIVHSNFDDVTKVNDIALIKMDRPVEFNDFIRPLCLPSSDAHFGSGDDCYVTGWGRSVADSPGLTPDLQMLKTKIMSQFSCRIRHYAGGTHILRSHVCLELNKTHPGSGICMGDSGGPLNCRVDGVFFAVGVASFVERGCRKKYRPDVYTRVSSYIQWIDEVMWYNK